MDENQNLESNTPLAPKKISLREQFTTVTPVSKFLAMVLFVALPFLGFWVGLQFQKTDTTETVRRYESPILAEPKQKPSESVVREMEVNTTTEGVSDLKEYRNEEYGFEFKFPADDFLVEEIQMTSNGDIALYVKIANKQSSGFLLAKKNLRNLELSSYILDPYINCVEGTENPCLDAPDLMPFSFDSVSGLQETFSGGEYGSYFFLH